MLQEQSKLFQRMLFVADLTLVCLGWTVAYIIRFRILTPPEVVPVGRYLELLPWAVFMSMLVFVLSGLYAPDRAQRLPRLVFAVIKATLIGFLALAASLSFYRDIYFSRLHLLLFGAITPVLMVTLRMVLYYFIRRARQQGRNLRRVAIVGAGRAGRKLANAMQQYPWMGFEVVGFFDDGKEEMPARLGTVSEVPVVVDRFAEEGRPIDYVYIALPLSAAGRIEDTVNALATRLPHVYLVPDIFQLDIINSRITDVDGLPVIHLIDEAPIEFRRYIKRGIDIAFSATFLLLAAPVMLVIALAVKLSSPGPVFYRQQRMGLNGYTFDMLKFRSMPVNAESSSGPVWAKSGEDRATPVGSFLRRTSLDELPQFINVLKGDMSVVGPRPERPVFIKEFREHVPRYMLRHKMKAGITGWAQVNGWRGNTSIERRIEYDLYYIQNWSIKLDFKIMVMTVLKGFVHENAY
jgi:putative colanic acid biosysnthesis UDP-glucose lipid carrier transferase